jgi:hypothetical protein
MAHSLPAGVEKAVPTCENQDAMLVRCCMYYLHHTGTIDLPVRSQSCIALMHVACVDDVYHLCGISHRNCVLFVRNGMLWFVDWNVIGHRTPQG